MLSRCIYREQRGLYQSKVTSSLAAIQRPGYREDSCKMLYLGRGYEKGKHEMFIRGSWHTRSSETALVRNRLALRLAMRQRKPPGNRSDRASARELG